MKPFFAPILGLLIAFALAPAHAAGQKNEVRKLAAIDSDKPVHIEFDYSAANKNPKESDNLVLVIKDTVSGKVSVLTLQESAENSSHFEGDFLISWNAGSDINPEIYLPSQKEAAIKDKSTLEQLVKDGMLTTKPFYLRLEKGKQLLSVYNSESQMLAANKKLRTQVTNAVPAAKPVVDQSVLEAQRAHELALEQARLAKLALEAEKQRQKLAEDEKRKQEELIKAQAALAEKEREKRKAEAKQIAEQAMTLFKAQKFTEAVAKFKKSIELDPANTTYHFQYGVALFKTEKYNEALVAFDLSTQAQVDPIELSFYRGLCHMKLKDYTNAEKAFIPVSNSDNKVMGPSASFFLGLIHFSQVRYKDAKKYFEKTVDTSDDPRLSDQADNYIEQIANIEQFEDMRKHPFTANVTGGIMYDSNVNNLSKTAKQGATDIAGLRFLVNAQFDYRIIFNQTWENTLQVGYTNMDTYNTSFKPSKSIQIGDPQVMQFKLPLKLKTKAFNLPYQVTFTPGYDTLALPTGVGEPRRRNQNSTYLGIDQTFVVNKDYITSIGIEFRNDDSKIANNDSADASKTSLNNSNILFRDAKKTEAILLNWGYTNNKAKGDSNSYSKIDLSAGYMLPVFKKDSVVSQISLALSNYAKASPSRNDTSLTLMSSYSHTITDALKGSVALSYNNTGSNVDTSKYDKINLTTSINWNDDF